MKCFSIDHRAVCRAANPTRRGHRHHWCLLSRGLNIFGQVVHVEHAVGVDHDHALDDVLELADVARPVIGRRSFRSGRGDRGDLLAVRGVNSLRKWSIEQGDVLAALAEGGQLDRDDLQAVIQVLAKVAGGDGVVPGRGSWRRSGGR